MNELKSGWIDQIIESNLKGIYNAFADKTLTEDERERYLRGTLRLIVSKSLRNAAHEFKQQRTAGGQTVIDTALAAECIGVSISALRGYIYRGIITPPTKRSNRFAWTMPEIERAKQAINNYKR